MLALVRFVAVLCLAGLLVTPVTAAATEDGYIGVQIKANEDVEGLLIVETVKDAPADKAGLKMGDLITKVDGSPIKSADLQTFVLAVRGTKPGDDIKLTIVRGGKEQEIKVTVGKRPEPQ
jgi:S1-C subfamily serine protease